MILVRVAGVALDPTGQHVILLKPVGGSPGEGRLLPIWIGAQEATSILVAIEGPMCRARWRTTSCVRCLTRSVPR
jgi:bifunctional DNase/RNase